MKPELFGPSQYPMVALPGGTFLMGSPEDEAGRFPNEGPLHEVDLAPFSMGVHPVTQAEYARFLAANPDAKPPTYSGQGDHGYEILGPEHPVVGVSWEQADAYCAWAGLSLPTEAQWEYACRAGTRTRYWSGDTEEDLARVAWYGGNSLSGSKPVGRKPANPFGLHDMHGNVWQWCADWFDERAYDRPTRPGDGLRDVPPGQFRNVRGGCWFYSARVARSATRCYTAAGATPFFGFRCVSLPGRERKAG